MKTPTFKLLHSKALIKITQFLFFLLAITLFISCKHPEPVKLYKVEVRAADFAFAAPSEIPSGWITFVLNNEKAKHVHELSISKLPEGIDYKKYMQKFVSSWEIILKELQNGKINVSGISNREKELLPEWANQVHYITSRGLASPGYSNEKTVYLKPGHYALECWVKTADGAIHISKGMTSPLTVTANTADSTEPKPKEKITVTENRIKTDWHPGLGKHTFALYLKKDAEGYPVHNNINLIKLDNNTSLPEVNRWLDWYHTGGLRSPSPAVFLGGLSTYTSRVENQAEYFTVNIKAPGQYAWIVQVPDGRKLWKVFYVE